MCTSELLESGLLGEGWLPAMRDAWQRHLHPDAIVLPQRARVYARLVDGALEFGGPYRASDDDDDDGNNPIVFCTTPRSADEPGFLSDGSYDRLTGEKHGAQLEIRAEAYLRPRREKNGGRSSVSCSGEESEDDSGLPLLKVLSEPLEVLSLDVSSPGSIPDPDPATRPQAQKRFVATDNGSATGVLFWWELDLGEEGETGLTYTTKPGSPFQDHWHQCLYVFAPRRNNDDNKNACGFTHLDRGKEYTLRTSHTDSRIHFSIDRDDAREYRPGPKRPRPVIPEDSQPVASPRRCRQLNDTARSGKFQRGIELALKSLKRRNSNNNNDTECIAVLDVSDFSLCGMMASRMGADNVTSVESSSSGLPLATARVAQIGNGLPEAFCESSGHNKTHGGFQIVRCHAESLTREILRGPSSNPRSTDPPVVDLVVGEPYYEMLEGWPIETALNFFYTIRMLKRKGIVRPGALSVPARAVVLACGIQCEDLGKAYQRDLGNHRCCAAGCGDGDDSATTQRPSVCGFDHTPVVDCWNYDKDGISLPLWEYTNLSPVTDIVEVGRLDYVADTIEQRWLTDDSHRSDSGEYLLARFTEDNATCNAVAFWVDYGIPVNPSGGSSETVSTGFGASHLPPGDDRVPCSSSVCAERQTVRILPRALPTVRGGTLVIPRHGLEL